LKLLESEKMSARVKKFEKLLSEEKGYVTFEEELEVENDLENTLQQKSRRETEKPLYLMRYE
jgi:hypothetical protein